MSDIPVSGNDNGRRVFAGSWLCLFCAASAYAQNIDWACEDSVFPVVLEFRTTADPMWLDARIDSGDYILTGKSEALIAAKTDEIVFLGTLVETLTHAEFDQEVTATVVERSAESLLNAFTFYSGKGGCGDDAESRAESLVNNSNDPLTICGETRVRVSDAVDAQFLAEATESWTPITTFTVTIESLDEWEETEEQPPDGFCE
ncbi:MAG: hypothetical protein ACFHX7_12345 [Pseudomonadota bacterium]